MVRRASNFIKRSISFYTGQSFIVHIVLFFALFGFSYYQMKNTDKIKKVNIKLIESSVRVDMVAMPKFTIKELKTISLEAPAPKVVEKPKKVVVKSKNKSKVEFKKKKKKLSFMDMLKKQAKKKLKLSKTKGKSNNNGKSNEISNSQRERLRKLLLAGNQINAGNAATGDQQAGDSSEYSEYLLKLKEKVKEYWKLPSFLLEQELTCRIQIFLKSDGTLLQTKIFQSSGNSEYDQKALKAVKSASPFAILPVGLRDSGVKGNISLGFPL